MNGIFIAHYQSSRCMHAYMQRRRRRRRRRIMGEGFSTNE
jgi:hypothetical protein